MFLAMVVLAVLGVALLLGAPVIARLLTRGQQDPVGLTRILQVLGVLLLIGALLVRPENTETTAAPPAPNTQAAPTQGAP